jgi:preprotein translocase SecE subunit
MAATATVTPSTATGTSDRLLPASIAAAAFILLGLAAVGYGVPKLLSDIFPGGSFAGVFARIVVQVAALAGFIYLGGKLAGANPPRGMRGGIFIVLSVVFAVFFLWRAVGLNFAGTTTGDIVTTVVLFTLLFFAGRFLISPRARDYMIGIEDMGWFHTYSYKRTQGLKMRRYTIVGILLIGLSGVWTLMKHGMLDETVKSTGRNDLLMSMPYMQPIAVLADMKFTIPLLLTGAILWLAWRAVNMPVFADFLIATEAEMNKVSWTPRKRLIQDTIVVLVTTLLLTAFLLVVDLFWGWALSQIGILPSKEKINQLKSQEQPSISVPWEPPGK